MAMRRVQIYIEPELDDALAVEAARKKVSKAALIREAVAQRLGSRHEGPDPLDALVGDLPGEAGDIDEIVYGR